MYDILGWLLACMVACVPFVILIIIIWISAMCNQNKNQDEENKENLISNEAVVLSDDRHAHTHESV